MSSTSEIPNGYYYKTKDYVDDCRQQGATGIRYLELNPGEATDQDFVAVIPNGRVWGPTGCVITPNQKILWDVSREWDNSPKSHSIFKAGSLQTSSYTSETVAVLSKIGSTNYYHWMFDVLPRVHLLHLSGIAIDKYIVHHPLAPYQYETLSALGITQNQLIAADPQFHLQSARLVVPSLPSEAKWACEFVRNKLLTNLPAEQPQGAERLYISRQNCIGRQILNEQEVMAALSPYGFIQIMPESMSVAEQVQAFANANVIIGPQGAGFTNAFFCRPGTNIIELMAPTFFITSTEKICSYLHLDYHRIMGTSHRNPNYVHSGWYWNGLDNIHVDIREILRTVESVL